MKAEFQIKTPSELQNKTGEDPAGDANLTGEGQALATAITEPQPLYVTADDNKEAGAEAATELDRDPFAVSTTLQDAVTGPVAPRKKSTGPVFTSSTGPANIPKMFLRGQLTGKDGELVALVEIDKGGVHIVREGDTIGLQQLGLDSVIRVKEINRLQVVIESGSLGRLIIVR